jgi:UPF0755 protein
VRFLIRLISFGLLLLAALAGMAWWWANNPLAMRAPAVEFRVAAGSSLRAAVSQMQEAGVDLPADPFALLAKWKRSDTGLKAGSYAIKTGITPLELLAKLSRGEVTQGELTLVEGWTWRQWRNRLDQHADLRHETAGLSEGEIIQKLGLNVPSLEGWLFPDTYLFDKQSSDLELLARSHRIMQKRLAGEWEKRIAGLPYKSPYEALIMASIVEKETGRESDRGHVAAVFVNRLRSGMLLQTDPTVIYGVGPAFDGNLRKRDLLTDTPYNTYTRAGLPPTPIAMPGTASLQAALHPVNSDVVYFVARGDGSSQFSRTLDEHNRAVNQYQRGRK